METSYKSKLSISFFLLFLFLSAYASSALGRKNIILPLANQNKTSSSSLPSSSGSLKTYIVHLQRNSTTASSSTDDDDPVQWYKSFLPNETVTTNEEGKSTSTSSRLIHAYKKVATGFAARLTEAELEQIKKKDEFVHAYPDSLLPLLTTHTSDFLGLYRDTGGFWNDSNYGKGVIIGVLDTGILPSHLSFGDGGMPVPPSKWNGVCEFDASSCNKKLIGARNFIQGQTAMQGSVDSGLALEAPYDNKGHGTHTAGTAAGSFVGNANVAGQANGTASGMAPLAHLAIYKVCGKAGCANSDILAGIDAAVADGVDILSLSLGGDSAAFYNDATAIGTFGAIENGIFVSCAAGNTGPSYGTLSNEAPWILTVGASTIDRSIRSTVQLGSGVDFIGESLVQPKNHPSTKLPLIYPGFIGSSDASLCLNSSLNGINVKGMIVLCDDGEITRVAKGLVVKSAGGVGMIIASTKSSGYILRDDVHVLPTSHVSYSDGLTIKTYINSATSPTASISFGGTVLGTSPAPMVAGFSSRGPNQPDPNILKPDIIGPGVNILAAWPLQVEVTNVASSTFNVISGTSMSTPHLSGIAALLKSSHPNWSPAVIKSAMMTTAYAYSNDGKFIPDETMSPANFFATGSGHINVSSANNPGMVYDISSDDYIAYLCGIPYNSAQVSAIVRRKVTCSDIAVTDGTNLNYPSFMVFLNAANSYTAVVSRTVTNVGAANSKYMVQVAAPLGAASVTVKPTTLSFTEVNEKAKYTVTFVGNVTSTSTSYSQGYLIWFSADSSIVVKSPIMIAVG